MRETVHTTRREPIRRFSVIGWLAFRFGISGTYFALLTIAFAEFTRIGFDHFTWVGASGGLFLKVVQADRADWINLRGTPTMFYYLVLLLSAAAFVLSAWLLRSRLGRTPASDPSGSRRGRVLPSLSRVPA